MKTPVLAVVLTLLPIAALAAEPFAKASIDKDGPFVAGQQIPVVVDVFAPNFFTDAPQFPLFELPNALVTQPQERSQNIVQTIDGVEYSGIRKTYAVVPEQSGAFTIPALKIELTYSDNGTPTKAEATSDPLTFDVAGSSAQTSNIAFAAKNLTMTQSFDREPKSLKAGEAIVRTVTVFAEDTQAMLIPPPDLGQPAGLQSYPKPPALADGVEVDGASGSQRIETVTYVATSDGTFSIPAATLTWFDVDAHAERTASLPATPLTVAKAEQKPSDLAPPEKPKQEEPVSRTYSRKAVVTVVAGVTLLALAGGLLWRARHAIGARLRRRSQSPHRLEQNAYRRLLSALDGGDQKAIHSALMTWCQTMGFATVAEWIGSANDAELADQVSNLERALFAGRDGSFDAQEFRHCLQNARKQTRQTETARPSDLPDLNPA